MVKFALTAAMAGFLAQGTPAPESAAPAAQAPPQPTISAAASSRPHTDMIGTWTYNENESLNAATGKSETARAVNDRRGISRGAGTPSGADPSPANGSFGGGGFSGAAGGASRGGARGPVSGSANIPEEIVYNLFIEQRDTLRDLMEIPWRLTIDVATPAVTMTDDLDRVLTFSADGRKQKYQLGAAMFDAKTTWDGGQFKMDIEGPDGLKILETWFLNEDGSKLFQIIRIGDQPRDRERPVGVNRVYDRAK